MDAIELVRRYAGRKAQCFDAAERVPFEGVVPAAWQDAVVDEQGRVERIPYELCLLGSLRDALRRREDPDGTAHRHWGVRTGGAYVVRPDGYIGCQLRARRRSQSR